MKNEGKKKEIEKEKKKAISSALHANETRIRINYSNRFLFPLISVSLLLNKLPEKPLKPGDLVCACVCEFVCVFVCVCVCERERDI